MEDNTITIKNELPELLEALCQHERCPDWLKNGFEDMFNRLGMRATWSATYWSSILEMAETNDGFQTYYSDDWEEEESDPERSTKQPAVENVIPFPREVPHANALN